MDGTIEAVNQATVSAQTSGRVVEILYDVNDVVPAGAVIVRLKGTEQRAGLQAAEAAVTEARARNEEAATSYQRIADLFQRRVVAKAQLDQATANRDSAAGRLAAAEAGLTAAREGVGYTEIRAPYGGVVTKRLVEVGETVGPGTPLMTGLSLRDLRVNTSIPQSIVMQVRKLKQAAIYVGDQRIEATKITIFPEAATPSSTFRARLDLPPGAAGSRARHVRQSGPRDRPSRPAPGARDGRDRAQRSHGCLRPRRKRRRIAALCAPRAPIRRQGRDPFRFVGRRTDRP